jgi:hypothetical protein
MDTLDYVAAAFVAAVLLAFVQTLRLRWARQRHRAAAVDAEHWRYRHDQELAGRDSVAAAAFRAGARRAVEELEAGGHLLMDVGSVQVGEHHYVWGLPARGTNHVPGPLPPG